MRKKYIVLYLTVVFLSCLLILVSCNDKETINEKEKSYLLENDDIIVGIYINYPPFQFVNENGNVDGILLDYFDILENKVGHKFKKKFYNNWPRVIEDANNQKIDVILEIQKTKNRLKYLTFTNPIFVGDHVVITKKGNRNNTIKKLIGKKVAVCQGYAIEEHIKHKYPKLNLVPLVNEEACIKALKNGDVEAFISLEPAANYIITKNGYKDLVIGEHLKYENELGIAINKNKPVLASIIKKGNEAISFDEKNEILNKWVYDLSTPIQNKNSFWRILLYIVAAILSLSFILSYYLKREVKKRTKQLNEAKLVAEKNNELKTLFLQNISHEVRTPLNSIIGFTSFIKEEDDEQIKNKYLNTILRESSNLTNILNNVIEISELTTKKTKPKIQTVAIDKELELIKEIYKNKANKKGLKFIDHITIEHDKSCILSDKSRLNRSITNLLDNAIKFTEQGNIVLSASINNDQLKIVIEDTGIGINDSELKSIFNEFYQEEKELSKKYDGLGIGLSIANENIKSLNGKIIPQTNKGEGSCFTIELPVKFVPNECDIQIRKINGTLKILITEDMRLNYLVLQKILEKTILNPKEIIWAKNGQEAVDLIDNNDFDIIFMDIKMPILNGLDATKIIKAKKPNIVVIAQTAYAQEEDLNKAKSIGFDAYLTKPIDSKALKITLQNLFMINISDDY